VVNADGISDMSDVVSRLINFIGNIIRDRLVSILKFIGPEKIDSLVNKIMGLIPDEIPIPGMNGLYIEGGVANNFTIKAEEYMSIPFDISF